METGTVQDSLDLIGNQEQSGGPEPTGTVLDSLAAAGASSVPPLAGDADERYRQGRRYLNEQSLEGARKSLADKKETTRSWLGRRIMLGGSALMAHRQAQEYDAARKRFEAGAPDPADYQTIAGHEKVQQADEEAGKTWGGGLMDIVARAPAFVGEAIAGGLAGKALGLAAPAAGTAAAARQTAMVAVPKWAGRTAVGTVLMPSLYAERWAHNNMEQGRDPLDVKGLPAAYGMGLIQNAILGSLQPQATKLFPGLAAPGAVTRVARPAVMGTIGAMEMMAGDAVGKWVGLQTKYGSLQDFIDGKWGDGFRHATLNAFTFALFSAAHEGISGTPAQHAERIKAYTTLVDAMAREGIAAPEAGAGIAHLGDALGQFLDDNPAPSRSDVQRFLRGLTKEGTPARAYADATANSFPEKVDPNILGSNAEPTKLPGPPTDYPARGPFGVSPDKANAYPEPTPQATPNVLGSQAQPQPIKPSLTPQLEAEALKTFASFGRIGLSSEGAKQATQKSRPEFEGWVPPNERVSTADLETQLRAKAIAPEPIRKRVELSGATTAEEWYAWAKDKKAWQGDNPADRLKNEYAARLASEVGGAGQALPATMGGKPPPPPEPPAPPPEPPPERPSPPGPPGAGPPTPLGPPRPGERPAYPTTPPPEAAPAPTPEVHPVQKAFQEVFPEGKMTPRGELEAKVGGRTVYVKHDPERNVVRIDFEDKKSGVPSKVQSGSKEFLGKLVELVESLKGTGVGLEYRATDANRGAFKTPRSQVYGRMLERAGYEEVEAKDGFHTWRPKETAPTPTPIRLESKPPAGEPPVGSPLEHVVNLYKRLKEGGSESAQVQAEIRAGRMGVAQKFKDWLDNFRKDQSGALDLDRLKEFGKGVWTKLFGKKTTAEVAEDSENQGYHNLEVNGKERGQMSLGVPIGNETRTANRMFPGVMKEGEKATRVQGVEVDDALQGKGLGQMLYLGAMINHGSDWYYNSQTYPPATNTLKALAKKGWLEVHWQERRRGEGDPDWDKPGGIHLVKVTPEGKEAYRLMTEGKESEAKSAVVEPAKRTEPADELPDTWQAFLKGESGAVDIDRLGEVAKSAWNWLGGKKEGRKSTGSEEELKVLKDMTDTPVYPSKPDGMPDKYQGPGWYQANYMGSDRSSYELHTDNPEPDTGGYREKSKQLAWVNHDEGRLLHSDGTIETLRSRRGLKGPQRMLDMISQVEDKINEKMAEAGQPDQAHVDPETGHSIGMMPEDYYAHSGDSPTIRTMKDMVKDFAKDESGALDLKRMKELGDQLWDKTKKVARHVQNELRKVGGQIAPETARRSPETANALAEVHNAPGFVQRAIPNYIDAVGGKKLTPEKDARFGEAFVEERQRAARDAHAQKASAATKAGDAQTAQRETAKAQAVGTSIGQSWSVIKDDAEYKKTLSDPEYKEAMKNYEQKLTPILEEWYRQAEGMDPNDVIATQTQLKGRPFYAKAFQEGDTTPEGRPFTASQGRLQNLKQQQIGSAHEASLSAERYETRLSKIIENTISGRYLTAVKAKALREAVKAGIGEFGPPGGKGNIGDQKAVELPFVSPPKGTQESVAGTPSTGKDRSFYIQEPVYQDFRDAWKVDQAASPIPGFNLINKANLAAFADAIYHSKNLVTMMTKPGMSPIKLAENIWGLIKGNPELNSRLTELARIAAAKPAGENEGMLGLSKLGLKNYDPTYWISKSLHVLDDAMRLTAEDAFTKLSKETINGKPVIENTEAAKRNFLNQLGQYIPSAQQKMIKLARETQIGPFATAGSNFLVQGLKTLVGGHGLETTGPLADLRLRAEVYGRVLGFVGAAMLTNFILHKRVDGDDKTPLGAIKFYDKAGHTVYWNLTDLSGLTRGLRQSGLLATMEGNRAEKPGGKISGKVVEDIAQGVLHPLAGPGPQFLKTALTGKNLMGMQVAEKPPVGGSEPYQNVKAAALTANPLVGFFTGADKPKGQESVLHPSLKLLGPYGLKEKAQDPIVSTYYDRLHDLIEHRKDSEERKLGKRWPFEKEFQRLHAFQEAITKLNHAIKGEVVVDGVVRQGRKPSEEQVQRLRDRQATLARRALQATR